MRDKADPQFPDAGPIKMPILGANPDLVKKDKEKTSRGQDPESMIF